LRLGKKEASMDIKPIITKKLKLLEILKIDARNLRKPAALN